MTITANPAEYEVDEFQPFNLTVTITDETAGTPATPTTPGTPAVSTPVNITSVTCTDTGVVTSFNANTFTVDGAITDAFGRSISYLDINNVSHTVTRFSALPDDFNALYSYIAPGARQTTTNVNVGLSNGSSLVYVITVNNNWGVANAQLHECVAKGRF